MSWGNKIILAFSGFVLFIGFLVYKSYLTRFDLVSKDYYKEELAYQDVIDASKNTAGLTTGLDLVQDGRNIRMVIPDSLKGEAFSGNIHFYCPYDSEKDLKSELKLSSNDEVIYDSSRLSGGRYILKIHLELKGKKYFIEKDLQIPS